jgi:prepilin peptidase CpaA
MEAAKLLNQIQLDLLVHREQYRLCIEAATIAVLFYIGFTDFRTFRIQNSSVVLLLVLYILDAVLLRSRYEILQNVLLAVVIFGVLLGFYARRLIGGGDVKLLSVACLWVGTHCALLFSAALLVFICLHLAAVRMGWAPTNSIEGRRGIPYAPALAAALISTILSGCA